MAPDARLSCAEPLGATRPETLVLPLAGYMIPFRISPSKSYSWPHGPLAVVAMRRHAPSNWVAPFALGPAKTARTAKAAIKMNDRMR